MPGKAANAGGVLVSGLEMSQNAEHLSWTFEEVDGKLEQLMRGMFHNVDDTAKEYGQEGNFVMGANIAGFLKSPTPCSPRASAKSSLDIASQKAPSHLGWEPF